MSQKITYKVNLYIRLILIKNTSTLEEHKEININFRMMVSLDEGRLRDGLMKWTIWLDYYQEPSCHFEWWIPG